MTEGSDEWLRTQVEAMERFYTEGGDLKVTDPEEFVRLGKVLSPYKCIGCYEVVYSTEAFVLKGGRRCHRECYEEIMKAAEEHDEWQKQQVLRKAKRMREIEENKRKMTKTITVTVTALKRDIEAFEAQIDKFAKQFNIEVWEKSR